jgi:hypothetical protein
MSEPGTVVIARNWFHPESELSYVTRLLAGAASRCGAVSVLVPGPAGTRIADGAFDLEGIGDETEPQWPSHLSRGHTVIVDELTPAVERLLTHADPGDVFFISTPTGHDLPGRHLDLVDAGRPRDAARVELHIPVNRLAERHRHHGFGFTGYQLVLSDRIEPNAEPPAAAAWVTAAFVDLDVVVVEAATAWAWKGRSLRGHVPIDTRMDLWRLLAHAAVCIDVSPGPFVARECIEALRFGTPILVPENSGPAAVHARAAGSSTFADAGELISSVSMLQDGHVHAESSIAGRRYADDQFGDPARFIESMRSLLGTPQ